MEDYFIKSLDNISDTLKLSPSVAGATLMAFGTSAPELFITFIALFFTNAHFETGLGSVIGSALFQTLVVIGIAATVRNINLDWKPVMRDSAFYAIAIILLILSIQDGVFNVIEGLSFVIVYLIYLGIMFSWSKIAKENTNLDSLDIVEEEMEKFHKKKSKLRSIWNFTTYPIDIILGLFPDPSKNKKWTWPIFLISLTIIGLLSFVLVFSSETLATALGLPPVLIALTVLAAGGSIPEVAGSAVVSKQGRGDMAVGNAIGSNVFDILISLGIPILAYTLLRGDISGINTTNIFPAVIVLFSALAVLLLIFAARNFKIKRLEGAMLIGVYSIYIVGMYIYSTFN